MQNYITTWNGTVIILSQDAPLIADLCGFGYKYVYWNGICWEDLGSWINTEVFDYEFASFQPFVGDCNYVAILNGTQILLWNSNALQWKEIGIHFEFNSCETTCSGNYLIIISSKKSWVYYVPTETWYSANYDIQTIWNDYVAYIEGSSPYKNVLGSY